jgi:hypothetical protein
LDRLLFKCARDISEGYERDRGCEKGAVEFKESAAVEEDLG